MSSVSNSLVGGYYQLSSQSGGTNTNSASSTTNVLLQALSGTNTNTTAASDPAYLLNLSPQAQSYLSGTPTSSATSALSGNSSFSLSSKQQQTITDILTKYKDAPYTQDTFNSIQNDLNAAGLGASTLKMIDQAKNFNPTALLLGALSGNYTAATTVDSATETGKANSYIQGVIKQWQGVSTTYQSAKSKVASAGGA